MEMAAGSVGARGAPSPNAGKVVKVRWVKRYPEAVTQICLGEVVRETSEYLVLRGVVLNFRKGSTELKRDEERVRWIPWGEIAVVCELPTDLKWRTAEVMVEPSGDIQIRPGTQA